MPRSARSVYVYSIISFPPLSQYEGITDPTNNSKLHVVSISGKLYLLVREICKEFAIPNANLCRLTAFYRVGSILCEDRLLNRMKDIGVVSPTVARVKLLDYYSLINALNKVDKPAWNELRCVLIDYPVAKLTSRRPRKQPYWKIRHSLKPSVTEIEVVID